MSALNIKGLTSLPYELSRICLSWNKSKTKICYLYEWSWAVNGGSWLLGVAADRQACKLRVKHVYQMPVSLCFIRSSCSWYCEQANTVSRLPLYSEALEEWINGQACLDCTHQVVLLRAVKFSVSLSSRDPFTLLMDWKLHVERASDIHTWWNCHSHHF